MSKDQRRESWDAIKWSEIKTRLVQIKIAIAAKRTEELVQSLPANWIEERILPVTNQKEKKSE